MLNEYFRRIVETKTGALKPDEAEKQLSGVCCAMTSLLTEYNV